MIVWNMTFDLELAWTREVPFCFPLLKLWSILNSDWGNLTFVTLSLTLEVNEAGLFHAWVLLLFFYGKKI